LLILFFEGAGGCFSIRTIRPSAGGDEESATKQSCDSRGGKRHGE